MRCTGRTQVLPVDAAIHHDRKNGGGAGLLFANLSLHRWLGCCLLRVQWVKDIEGSLGEGKKIEYPVSSSSIDGGGGLQGPKTALGMACRVAAWLLCSQRRLPSLPLACLACLACAAAS